MDTDNNSLDLRKHKTEAVRPSEENSIARCYDWTKAGRKAAAKEFPNDPEVKAWKDTAPLCRVMMTFSSEELVKLHRESRKNATYYGETDDLPEGKKIGDIKSAGMVKLTVALWDSKFRKTSDGWSAEAPKVDEYRRPEPKPVVVEEVPHSDNMDEVIF